MAVDPYAAVVVHGSEIEQRAAVLDGHLCLEAGLEPYCSLVEEQPLVLRIPVAGYLHGGGFVEVVLYEVFGLLGLGIDEESPSCRIHAVVVIAFFLYIDNIVPLAVEKHRFTAQHICYLGYFIGKYRRCQQTEQQ